MGIDPAIIGGGLQLLGGLFGGGGDHSPAKPDENLVLHAKGARDAAKQFGFNPLTLLGLGGQGYGPSRGAPPLASALEGFGAFLSDNFGSEANTRKEHNKLQTELLRLQVDKARSLSAVAPPSAVAGMGGAALGARRVAVNSGTAGRVGSDGPFSLNVLTGDREVKQTPTEDISGFMKVRNAMTDEDGFYVPGSDGEPLDIWQVPVVAGSWAASEVWELGSKAGAWLRDSPNSPVRRHDFGPPDGHTADGRPFWRMPDGSINFNPWANKPVTK
nr:MAG: DNA pilot protein [Microvirus sp.]